MEYNLKNITDITYQSELTPPSCFRKKAGGINSSPLIRFTFAKPNQNCGDSLSYAKA
jgi:hypothetical protein